MRRYRKWAGNEKGDAERPTDCIVEVADGGRSVLSHQCGHKRGKGPGGLYCARHAKCVAQGRYVNVPKDSAPADAGGRRG